MSEIAPETAETQPRTASTGARTSRLDQLRKMLQRKGGATIAQMQNAFGWQPHTARAAVSGMRKSGVIVERSEGTNGAVYRIVSAKEASQ